MSMLSSLGVQKCEEVMWVLFPFGVGEAVGAGESSKRRDDVCSGEGVESGNMDESVGDWAIRGSCTNLMFGGRADILCIGRGSKVSIAAGSEGGALCPSNALTWGVV